MATLQETAVTWHIINARSHTAVMEYGSSCIWVSVCDSLPQRGGIFFHLFLFFFPGSWRQWGIETAEANLSFKTDTYAQCFRRFFACLFHAPRRHGGCPSVLWLRCSGCLGNSSRSYVTYVILSCYAILSRANCTCKQARRAKERRVCTTLWRRHKSHTLETFSPLVHMFLWFVSQGS